MKVTTVDLSEGGMAVTLPNRRRPAGRWEIVFTLPGTDSSLGVAAEFAWEGTKEQVGLRFVNPTAGLTQQLREWLKKNSPDAEQDDPPVRCQLTDLSLGGCYLEISSPFPIASRLTISMRAAGVELRVLGVVRIMHPDKGMGIEFSQNTPEYRAAVEKFLKVLTENRSLSPELFVQAEGLELEASEWNSGPLDADDPLLQLFHGEPLAPEAFHEALRKQRAMPPVIANSPPVAHQAASTHA